MLHRDPLTLSAESNGDPREARLSSQTNEERPIATPNKANLKSCLQFPLTSPLPPPLFPRFRLCPFFNFPRH